MTTNLNAQWIVGFVDGEGCFQFRCPHQKGGNEAPAPPPGGRRGAHGCSRTGHPPRSQGCGVPDQTLRPQTHLTNCQPRPAAGSAKHTTPKQARKQTNKQTNKQTSKQASKQASKQQTPSDRPPHHPQRPQLHWHRAHPAGPAARGRGRGGARAGDAGGRPLQDPHPGGGRGRSLPQKPKAASSCALLPVGPGGV
jgi:hypothetical protein